MGPPSSMQFVVDRNVFMRRMTVKRLILKELHHMTMYIHLCRRRKVHIFLLSFFFSDVHVTHDIVIHWTQKWGLCQGRDCHLLCCVSVDRTTLVTHRKVVTIGYRTGYTVRKTGNLMLLLIIHETNDLTKKFAFIASKSYLGADICGANGHTRSKTPVLFHSQQLTNRGRAQYIDRRPKLLEPPGHVQACTGFA